MNNLLEHTLLEFLDLNIYFCIFLLVVACKLRHGTAVVFRMALSVHHRNVFEKYFL